ncbi:hypothetical protein F8S13_03815 [Chloroflexia bacterium SDU3-3]|nr:hypothetical protein F8S13_03815 [Chloroflexia bacterium SDU3-3]
MSPHIDDDTSSKRILEEYRHDSDIDVLLHNALRYPKIGDLAYSRVWNRIRRRITENPQASRPRRPWKLAELGARYTPDLFGEHLMLDILLFPAFRPIR